jgi:hypothetical protein
MLISIFDLRSTPEDTGRTAASVRAERERRKLESAWPTATPDRDVRANELMGEALKREYAEFLDKDRVKRKHEQGLLGQTILEEDDDSEDGF